MSEEQKTPMSVAKKNTGHRFEIGHPRYGGKRRNSTQQVRDLCTEMDVDPMRFMLSLIKDGVTTQVVIENGKRKRVEVVASLETRTDLAKYVSRFMYPTLTATQVTGRDEGPVEVVGFDITKLLQDPAMVEMAQTLGLALAERERSLAPACVHGADQPKGLPAPDPTEDFERSRLNGHWKK
jgi:hypothetical protein